jgi:tetrapyrrole methylase family protein/MazG family protein
METGSKAIEDLIAVMDKLLSTQGCPWDREQTHQSLTRYLIEECYEVLEAIKEQDMDKLREELGDVLLQVVFHAALAQRAGYFSFADVARTVEQKMIRRHPHVFGDMNLKTSDDVMDHWEGFKKQEGKTRVLEGIPNMLPALMRAEKLQYKASQVGFDWPQLEGALDKLKEEADELAQAQGAEITEEMGDLLFALVNVARFKEVEPEDALQKSNDKFVRRFNYVEDAIKASGRTWQEVSLEEMDHYWDEAKEKGL